MNETCGTCYFFKSDDPLPEQPLNPGNRCSAHQIYPYKDQRACGMHTTELDVDQCPFCGRYELVYKNDSVNCKNCHKKNISTNEIRKSVQNKDKSLMMKL